MSKNSDLFKQTTNLIVPNQIGIGNDMHYTLKGSGEVKIQMLNDVIESLKEAYFVK